MKLYYHPLSPYSQKVLMAGHEKGITWGEKAVVNIFDPAAKAKYKETNPLGRVPFLVLTEKDDWQIPESSIIIEYLDQHFDSGTKLLPSDPDESRQARFMDRVSDLYMIDPLGSLLFENMKPENERNANDIARWNETVSTSFKLANITLGERKFAMGDQFGFGDLAMTSAIGLAQFMQFPLNDFPNIMRWYGDVSSRDSYKKVMAEVMPAAAAFQASLKK